MRQSTKNGLLIFGLVLSVAAVAPAQGTYSVVHSFVQADGANPKNPGMLAEGFDGKIYGTNPSKLGASGTVIQYSPFSGLFNEFDFAGGAGGNVPLSGVTLGVDGNLYGTTQLGGLVSGSSAGFGTVFRYTLGSNAPVAIRPFTNGAADGAFPVAPPMQTQDGSLWGVTSNGSTPGTWYKMDTSGNLLNNGLVPSTTTAPLEASQDGNLYGTTPNGGSSNQGTVYKLTQAGQVIVLHNFDPNSPALGLNPSTGLIEGFDGFLYGATCWGGLAANGTVGSGSTGQGTVFMVTRDGSTFKSIHSFQDNASVHEGSCPTGNMVQGSDGMLYGTTSRGGGTNVNGVLFRMNTDGSNFQVLHSFVTASGRTPQASLFLHTNGIIYGLAKDGGTLGLGALYSYDAHLQPFAKLVTPWTGPVGTVVNVIGQGFNSATGVLVGGVAVPWTKTDHPNIVSDTWMQVKVPSGAHTGFITVIQPSGNLVTRETFKVTACNPFVMRCL